MSAPLLTAVTSPAMSAFWWPRLRLSFTPPMHSFSAQSLPIMSQVESDEPSSTSSRRLLSETFPAAASESSFCRMMRELSGSTSSSL